MIFLKDKPYPFRVDFASLKLMGVLPLNFSDSEAEEESGQRRSLHTMHQLHLWLSTSPRVRKGVFCHYFGEKFTLEGQKTQIWQGSVTILCPHPGWSESRGQLLKPAEKQSQPGQWSAGHRGVLALPSCVSPTLALQENSILSPDTKLKCKIPF